MLDRQTIQFVLEDLYRTENHIPEGQKIGRQLRFKVDRNIMRQKVLHIYRENPLKFHRENGKFVGEWLCKATHEAIDKEANPNSAFRSNGDKFVQKVVRQLKIEGKIPAQLVVNI